MTLTITNVELAYANVVAGTPIHVDIPCFYRQEIYVYYGDNRDLAVQGVDYNVDLDVDDQLNPPPPNSFDYQFVVVTPTASLIAKIGAGTNIIYVRRTLPDTTDFNETDAFTRSKIDVEFTRTLMRIQDLQHQINAGLVQHPSDIDAALSAAAAAASATQACDCATNAYNYMLAAQAAQNGAEGSATNAANSAQAAANSAASAAASAAQAAAAAAAAGAVPPPVSGQPGQALVVNPTQTAYTFAWRVPTAADTTMTIANGDGVAGNPTFAVNQAANYTWTGVQVFGSGSGPANVYIDGGAGSNRNINFRTSGSLRWIMRGATATAEGGANAGSNFSLEAYSDAGAFLFAPLTITRSTGLATFAAGLTVNGGAATFTGNVNLSNVGAALIQDGTSGGTVHYLRGNAGTSRWLEFDTGTVARWRIMGANPTAEGGANAGSDFVIQAFNDAGGSIGNALVFTRSSMAAAFGASITAAGTITAQPASGVGVAVTARTTGAADASLIIDAPVQRDHNIHWQTSGSIRWRMNYDGGAESGANAGSNWIFQRYSDAGALLATTLKVTRSTGLWEFNDGLMNLGDGTGAPVLAVKGAAGQIRRIDFSTVGSMRWRIQTSGAAESGGNAGSEFRLERYDDSGAYIGAALTVTRSTGLVTLPNDVTISGTIQGAITVSAVVDNVVAYTTSNGNNQPSMGVWQDALVAGEGPTLWFFCRDNGGNKTGYARVSATNTNGTVGSQTAQLNMVTIVTGTRAVRGYFGSGLVMSGASGGDKGTGSINAQNVYDDNVLLTCYVLEAANQNDVNTAKWDAYVPDRELPDEEDVNGRIVTPARLEHRVHSGAHAFRQRMDELKLSVYTQKWRDTGVLPGMPTPDEWQATGGLSTGAVISRLWEQAELHAVHLAELLERIEKLEKAA